MSGAQHTPGPWKALIHETLADAREDSGFTWLHSEAEAARFLPLGCVWQDTGSGLTGLPGHVETTAANARLIAAAPQLYEAAVKHLEWIEKEHAGPDYAGLTRDTHPDGESIWRKWWNEQLDLCADTERLCLTATAKARGETA